MKKLLFLISISLLVYSCGIVRPTEGSKVPVSGTERVKKILKKAEVSESQVWGKKVGIFCFHPQIQCGEPQWIN